MPLHRRVARLSPENYFGRQTYFVTICCDHRAPFLRTPATAQSVLAVLLQCAATHSFLLHAYCLLPDHSHVLAEGLHERSDLREFIRVFKQRSAFACFSHRSKDRPLQGRSHGTQGTASKIQGSSLPAAGWPEIRDHYLLESR